MQKRVPVAPDGAHCSTCMLGHVCVPVGMAAAEVEKLDELVKAVSYTHLTLPTILLV